MLYTIGYEGLNIDQFLNELQSQGIDVLVDVRQMPLSRKKGFSKKGLSERIEAAGIRYSHLKELGAPREVRYRLKETGDWGEYCEGYNAYLEGQKAALVALTELAAEQNICLMCFEANFKECHRSLITEALEHAGAIAKAVHLTPQKDLVARQRAVA